MELLQLKYFQTVAYTEHISKAAEQLNISQPSLSLTIKKLENELGTPLFKRKGRNIQLNHSGKILLKYVNGIFTDIENAQLEIQSEQLANANTIKISISNTRFLKDLISKYVNNFPTSKIQQNIRTKDEIQTLLKLGDISLGIAGPPIVDSEIESYVLINEDIVLALPSNHKYVDKSEISLSEISNEPFITLANNQEYSNFTTQLCKDAGFLPNNIFEVDSNILVELIRFNQGMALLPISVCKNLKLNYIKITKPTPTFIVGLSWVKGKLLSNSEKQFRDFIISYYKDTKSLYKIY